VLCGTFAGLPQEFLCSLDLDVCNGRPTQLSTDSETGRLQPRLKDLPDSCPPLQGATCLYPLAANLKTMTVRLAGTLLRCDMSDHWRPKPDVQTDSLAYRTGHSGVSAARNAASSTESRPVT
jgi:hypothetical protein